VEPRFSETTTPTPDPERPSEAPAPAAHRFRTPVVTELRPRRQDEADEQW
jgi:hypothetical protein